MRYNSARPPCLDTHTPEPADTARIEKARRLLAAGLVQHQEDGSYHVGSESLPGWQHLVTPRRGTAPAACTCRDYLHRQRAQGGRCAHLWAARFAEEQLRETQARLRAELAAPAPALEAPSKPRRYRVLTRVIIRRPTLRAAAALLEVVTRREAQRQAALLRELRCGTRADDPNPHPDYDSSDGWELATP
jgi:hypothetical protein